MVEAEYDEQGFNDEIDEILIWVMVVTDEIHYQQTVAVPMQYVGVEGEVIVCFETEVIDDAEVYELGVEIDM